MAQGYGKDLGLSRDSRTGETGLHIYVYIYICLLSELVRPGTESPVGGIRLVCSRTGSKNESREMNP